MLNAVWILLILAGVWVAGINGKVEVVTEAAMNGAKSGVELSLALAGIFIFWLGIARIAEAAGLMRLISRLMQPLFGLLFPSVPRNHASMDAMMMNISANLLGLGSAATPFGLRAMQELQKLNPDKTTATDAMVTFLALNTSSITLVPATIIAVRATLGSHHSTEIVVPTLIATGISTSAALTTDYLFRQRARRRQRHGPD